MYACLLHPRYLSDGEIQSSKLDECIVCMHAYFTCDDVGLHEIIIGIQCTLNNVYCCCLYAIVGQQLLLAPYLSSIMRTYLRRMLHSYQESRQYERINSVAASGGTACAYSTPEPIPSTSRISTAPLEKYYRISMDSMPGELQSTYTPLHADAETQEFLDSCQSNWCISFLARVLRWFFSVTDTNAILKRGQMFVLSKAQVERLLSGVLSTRSRERQLHLLDVGAGDGNVTARLAPYFDSVTATEVSPYMGKRLQERGYRTHVTAYLSESIFPHPGVYDVVSIFNVLDRCDHPLDLIKSAVRLLKPDGRLLLAVVLPFSEFVEEGTRKRAVIQPLPMRNARCGDGASFEKSLSALICRVLLPLGLTIEHISKVPYLCRGDSRQPYYVLSDAIIVCKMLDPEAPRIVISERADDHFAEQLSGGGGPLMKATKSRDRAPNIIRAPVPVDIANIDKVL